MACRIRFYKNVGVSTIEISFSSFKRLPQILPATSTIFRNKIIFEFSRLYISTTEIPDTKREWCSQSRKISVRICNIVKWILAHWLMSQCKCLRTCIISITNKEGDAKDNIAPNLQDSQVHKWKYYQRKPPSTPKKYKIRANINHLLKNTK